MPEARALLGLFVDFASLRQGMASLPALGGEEAPNATDVSRALVQFVAGGGRLGASRAYADWSRDPDGPRVVSGTRLEAIMVPATDDGEDRSHIRLVVDAMDILHRGDDPDAFVIVSDDPTLLPLARAIRSAGAQLVVVAPSGDAGEVGKEADLAVALADVVAGAELEPVRLRPARQSSSRGGGSREAAEGGGRPRREQRAHVPLFDGGSGPDPDFSSYDWGSFVRLVDELEERLPFVGVRYLVNKVLAPHNCGIQDPRLKRDLINEAVDEGIIELYTVGNLEERLDPVTACRLDRSNGIVATILGSDAAEGDDIDDLDDHGDDDDFEPFEDEAPSASSAPASARLRD